MQSSQLLLSNWAHIYQHLRKLLGENVAPFLKSVYFSFCNLWLVDFRPLVRCGYHRCLSWTLTAVWTQSVFAVFIAHLWSYLHYNLIFVMHIPVLWHLQILADTLARVPEGEGLWQFASSRHGWCEVTEDLLWLCLYGIWTLTATFVEVSLDPILDHLPSSHHYAFFKVNFNAILPSIPRCHKWTCPSSFPITIYGTVHYSSL